MTRCRSALGPAIRLADEQQLRLPRSDVGGSVVDADPRTISNLIADQTLNNPAAISAALTYAGITGAAQMTAISQIQAARAAIAQAQARCRKQHLGSHSRAPGGRRCGRGHSG